MAAMPRATVTFLFSDIEGSTRLLRDLGAQYEHVLDDQRRLLREAIEGANGRIVDVSGDAVFAAMGRDTGTHTPRAPGPFRRRNPREYSLRTMVGRPRRC
jgi:class 3 adenylate cyclase